MITQDVMSVIIVNDNAGMRELWAYHINKTPDMRCIAVGHDGQSAIDLVRQHNPDIILLDVMMPGMNGIEATKQILKESPDSTIIIHTVHTTVRDECLDAGAVLVLTLPISATQLIDSIRQTMRK